MICWWKQAGVERADLAIKRPSRAMLWHYGIPLESLPLSWARAENVRKADVYIRPTRVLSWPLVLLDDVPVITAVRIAKKYDALVVKTSEEGGCHVWLSCSCSLDEERRGQAQRWLAQKTGADHRSTSGEHLGRLAGFKSWKRSGTWVNVVKASHNGCLWVPKAEPGPRVKHSRHPHTSQPSRHAVTIDTSQSGREWGWICGLLESGSDPRSVYYRLVERARPRRGKDAERYARRTVERALKHVAMPT